MIKTNNVKRSLLRVLVFLGALFGATFSAQASIDFCWKDSAGRGVGTVPQSCPSGSSAEGALCYSPCGKGYESSTWGACLQKCNPAHGLSDNGLFCRKAEYHVAEYPWEFGDPLNDSKMKARCEARHGVGKCEKRLLVYVEKCKDGFEHILGFCRPKSVPNCEKMGYGGQFDLSCTKKTYFKTPKTMVCGSGKVNDAGLCYKKCDAGMTGAGPVCWASCSSNTLPTECGAGCAKDEASCATQTADLVISVLDSAVSIASAVGTLGVATAAKTAATTAGKLSAKQALKQTEKAAVKELVKHAGKVSGSVAKQFAKDTIKDMVVKNGFEYVGSAASATTNAMSLVSNITDITEGKYASEDVRDFMIAQEVLNNVSLLDPSGILGIVASYTKPKCSVLASGEAPSNEPDSAADALVAEFSAYENNLKARHFLLESRLQNFQVEYQELSGQHSRILFDRYANPRMQMISSLKKQKEATYAKLERVRSNSSDLPDGKGSSDTATRAEVEAYLRDALSEIDAADKVLRAEYQDIGNRGHASSLIEPEDVAPLRALQAAMDAKRQEIKNAANEVQSSERALAGARTGFARMVEARKPFWGMGPGRGYALGLSYSEANKYCAKYGAKLATRQQLIAASEHRNFSMCAVGWLAGQEAGYVMTKTQSGCGHAGYNSGGKLAATERRGAYCVGGRLPPNTDANNIDHVRVTGAITLPENESSYLFLSNGTYNRSDKSRDQGFDANYPKQMPGGWEGVVQQDGNPFRIDAALPYLGGLKRYMWSGPQLLVIGNTKLLAGEPEVYAHRPWGTWAAHLDAAIYYPPNEHHYLFKGKEYARFSSASMDAGYPKPLPGGWRGMPAAFQSGIDAATYRKGHVYMIKGNQYIRFTGTQMDPGYPKYLSSWPQ